MGLKNRLLRKFTQASNGLLGFTFRVAKNQKDLDQVYRTRHEVYKNEGYIQPREKGVFKDKYDDFSVNFLALKRGEPVGTVRLVLNSELGFPTENLFNFERPEIKQEKTVEISRLAVKKNFRGGKRPVMLGLMKEIYDFCRENNIKYIYANMPKGLADHFSRYGVNFEELKKKEPTDKNIKERRLIRGYFDQKELNPYLFEVKI